MTPGDLLAVLFVVGMFGLIIAGIWMLLGAAAGVGVGVIGLGVSLMVMGS